MKYAVNQRGVDEARLPPGLMSPGEIAASFLATRPNWFQDLPNVPRNAFYGKYDETLAVLTYVAENDAEPPNLGYLMITAVNKFDTEWLSQYFDIVADVIVGG